MSRKHIVIVHHRNSLKEKKLLLASGQPSVKENKPLLMEVVFCSQRFAANYPTADT